MCLDKFFARESIRKFFWPERLAFVDAVVFVERFFKKGAVLKLWEFQGGGVALLKGPSLVGKSSKGLQASNHVRRSIP